MLADDQERCIMKSWQFAKPVSPGYTTLSAEKATKTRSSAPVLLIG
jgi:hypothetical protein